jgi:hypothetical protein
MSYQANKTSNYTGSDILLDLDRLNNHFRALDSDLKNLYFMSSPIYQFGTGSQYEYLQSQGDGTWDWSNLIGGWSITADTLYSGTGATYIGLKPGTGIWLGDEAFLSAPFSVDPAGVLHAHSGTIGGWYLGTTEIKSDNITADSEVLLDQSNGLIRVGPTAATYITIDGANRKIFSSDYVSGPLGAGFGITTELSEFQNIRARGKLVGATFEKDTISAVGGNFLVADSDILDTDMTALDNSTLTITGDTTFSIGDILRIRDGIDDEWFEVTNIDSAPTYTVTRDKAGDYTSNANPIWKKGTCVVNFGASGEGVIFMTASEANAPHIDVITHAGEPWTTLTTHMRMGNLNGYLDYATDLYGIAIGKSDAYLKYDPTNGLRVAGHTLLGSLSISTGGYISSGQTAYNTGAGYWFEYNAGTPRFSLGNPAGNYITWDGANLAIKGSITITGGNATQTFYQDGIPTSLAIGDMWIDTDDGNKLYIAESVGADQITAGEWVEIEGGAGGITTFRQSAVPTAVTAGDLWIDTDDNKLYRATNAGDDEITAGEWELQNAAIATGWSHASDTTKIDGGDIYTGTVTATQISVSQLDAITVNTGTLTVDEYINAGSNVTIDGDNEVFKVFGDTVTIEAGVNDDLDWTENGSTKTADLDADDYTPTELAAEIQAEMRAAGNANTTATYSSTTKKITIANSTLTTLTFLWSSGANTATTCGRALGFNVTADDTGALTYTADYQTALRVELGKLS